MLLFPCAPIDHANYYSLRYQLYLWRNNAIALVHIHIYYLYIYVYLSYSVTFRKSTQFTRTNFEVHVIPYCLLNSIFVFIIGNACSDDSYYCLLIVLIDCKPNGRSLSDLNSKRKVATPRLYIYFIFFFVRLLYTQTHLAISFCLSYDGEEKLKFNCYR